MKWLTTIITILSFQLISGQQVTSFNDNWQFSKSNDSKEAGWESVQLPHTWNDKDPFDKIPRYYRGVGWYKKEFAVSAGSRYYLAFEGVNQATQVFINGKEAGSHLGGYTGFQMEITDLLNAESNEILVKVDNSHDESVPPLKGDFNFYGGIYRDVWLYQVKDIHFNFSAFGDKGIFIKTPEVSEKEAEIEVTTFIHNQSDSKSRVVLEHKLLDQQGKLVSTFSRRIWLSTGVNEITSQLETLPNPKLWHPDKPNLYQLVSKIKSTDNQVLDTQSNLVGFRWFRFDPNEGFFINGRPLKLMGANRHQDYEGLGNALSDERHFADVLAIKEMGSNFFRTAHYPQDPAVLRAADQLGLLISMEIPLDHEITDSPEFLANSKVMQQEMIRQFFNHPSIIIWAYMNEMMLGRKWDRDKDIIAKIRNQAIELEELTRKEDPSRYTMIPNHGDLDLYIKSGLTEIPMIVGWNLYYGWYEEDGMGAGKFLDRFHELVPEKPVLITEYGAGADPRIRSLNPERFDFSIEWHNQFHQSNLIQYFDRKYLSGAAIWNIADFGSEGRNDADPKINSKGVLSYDRSPKDAYYLYQAWLKEDPVVRIGSRNWSRRMVNDSIQYPIDVYTNQSSAELFLNGVSLGEQKVERNVATWKVSLIKGINTLVAKIEDQSDQMEIEGVELSWYEGLNINCGATFYFNDPINQSIWIPDSQYTSGTIYRPRDRGVGSDKTIQNTHNDPVYQTHRMGGAYQFDVAPGTYEIVFHWAQVKKDQSSFDVLVNNQKVFSKLDVEKEAGFATAYSRKVIIRCENSLVIEFQKQSGDPMISGLQIKRLN